jgi:hypothetical protein
MTRITRTGLLLLSVFLLATDAGCKKDYYKEIPSVYVDVYLDISSTLYIELSTVGGYVNLTGGYRGITVYRGSIDEFVAFERCCPYDPEVDSARVKVDTSGLTLSDAACGSTYLILDGSVVDGPATMPLKQYRTYFDGDILHITN